MFAKKIQLTATNYGNMKRIKEWLGFVYKVVTRLQKYIFYQGFCLFVTK